MLWKVHKFFVWFVSNLISYYSIHPLYVPYRKYIATPHFTNVILTTQVAGILLGVSQQHSLD